jgi:hypothetical protein
VGYDEKQILAHKNDVLATITLPKPKRKKKNEFLNDASVLSLHFALFHFILVRLS